MPVAMLGGTGTSAPWGLVCEGQDHLTHSQHLALPSPPGAGCDLGKGRPPPPLSQPRSLDR
eukprot:11151355-Prorocentrum_lima.AAC.1